MAKQHLVINLLKPKKKYIYIRVYFLEFSSLFILHIKFSIKIYFF